MKFKLFCIVSLAFLLAVSCRREGPEALQNMSGRLIDAYYGGANLRKVFVLEGRNDFRFTDGSAVILKTDELKVFDCTTGQPFPTLAQSYQKGDWTYNDIHSGVPVEKDKDDREARMVCAAFDDERLVLYLSNGSELTIPDSPEKNLTSFIFRASDNMALPEGFACKIEGQTISGTLPDGVKEFRLCPYFTFRGKGMKVNGNPQVPGGTKQDFSNNVVYTLELYGGKTIDFKVKIITGRAFPTVYINTDNFAPVNSKDVYVAGKVRFEDLDMRYSDERVLESRMKIKGRGNSTWNNFPKKPYRIKLDEKQKVFGQNKNKDWVLLANYSDKSLMRNMVAMKLSEICEMSWTPVMYPVEVYLNNKYNGLYTFSDHKEVAKHRVDIQVAGPDDNSGDAVTGGYYFEIEQQMDEPVCFWTPMGVPMMFKDPERPTDAQLNYVKQYFTDFENALRGANFASPSVGYAKYIDVDSFVNYYIIQEIVKNIDGNLRKSSFLTKTRGGKLEMYHVWDFDLVLGNCDYFQSAYPGSTNDATGWFIKDYGFQGRGAGWYPRLFKDPAFAAKVKARWKEVYPRLRDEVPAFIDEQMKLMAPAANRNFETWRILGQYVWPNYAVLGTWPAEVAYMKQYYLTRINWINSNINSL